MNQHTSHARHNVVDALRTFSKVAIVSHTSPDPDALGAALGLALGLRTRGVQVQIVNESPVPPTLAFLPAQDEIKNSFDPNLVDAVIVVDCATCERAGAVAESIQRAPSVVNIDHHVSNDGFGTVQYVRGDASSASELVNEILQDLDIAMDAAIATCLYAGIAGDTGFFKYNTTTAGVLHIAGALVECGAKPAEIARALAGNVRLAAVRLKAAMLQSMWIEHDGKFIMGMVDETMFSAYGARDDDTENFIDELRSIQGVLVAAFVRWDVGRSRWRVSLRSKSEAVDVASIAAQFGGGGHRLAAAFRSSLEIDDLRETLIASVKEALGG